MTHPGTRFSSRVAVGSIPSATVQERAKAGLAPGDRAVPQLGTGSSQQLEQELSLSTYSCLTQTQSHPGV